MGKVSIDLYGLASGIADLATGGKAGQPKPNPAFGAKADKDGFLRDKEGNLLPDEFQPYDGKKINTTQPYQDPSWATRMFHPDVAKEQNFSNIAATQADEIARLAHERVLGLATSDAAEVKAKLGLQPSDLSAREAAILSGGSPTYDNFLGMANAAGQQFNGLPVKTAQEAALGRDSNIRRLSTYNMTRGPEDSGMTQAYNDYNALTGEKRKAEVGLPVNTVDALNSGALRETLLNKSDMSLIPKRTALNDITLGLDTAVAKNNTALLPTTLGTSTAQAKLDNLLTQGKVDAAPDVVAQLGDEAKVAAALSKGRAAMTSQLVGTQGNEIRTAARNSTFPAPAVNPLYVTPDGKVARNPFYGSILQTMNAKLGKGEAGVAGTNTTPLGNGLVAISNQPIVPVGAATASLQPVANSPSTTPSVARPAVQSWLDTQAQPNAPISDTKIPVEGYQGYFMDMQGNLYDSSGALISNPKQYHTNVLDAAQKQLNTMQDTARARARISRAAVYSNPDALAFPN